ncbi:MAG: TRAP transporter substrate-binding protein [Alphaproteobacteria bacterium]|nr:TRAP transporter substrate-binding protein [Alphaproteobacteria bacterium]MDX5370499.1 TRAP transporter substrate-binding protein [Alphaproteobacteria bacterium]MDX5464998.1 TRAP transporter substrate-binding protein [Alphaproteobacteria bacterium]
MDRRSFIKGAGVATAAAAATTFAAPAIAQGMRELKMVTTWPKNFPGLGTGAQRVADNITKATDGRIKVTLYAAGELVPPFESHDAVQSGAADMYHAADYYWQGKSKAYNFCCTVPSGLLPAEMDAWMHHMGGSQIRDELGEQFNMKHFSAGNTGSQMGGWFAKEINTLEDLKGLKIRMPGFGGEVMRRLGATAVNLPGGEIFPSLQSGAIDATEWVGPWNDLAFGFYKVVKYYYYPGFHEPGPTLGVGMNKGVWDSLSDSDKAVVEAVCMAENNYSLAEFNANNGRALDELINKHGVQLRKFSDELFTAFFKTAQEVVAESAEGDPITKKMFESYEAAYKSLRGWTQLSDQPYANLRDKAMDM